MGSEEDNKRRRGHPKQVCWLLFKIMALVALLQVVISAHNIGFKTITTVNDRPRATSIKTKEETNSGGILPRPFSQWSYGHEALCQQGFDRVGQMASARKLPIDNGLQFLKPVKTGSSTTSGVNLRIARNIARRLDKNFTYCNARFNHGQASLQFSKRDRKRSFLWTVLRDPTQRAISMFFHFRVSREEAKPTDENFQKYLLPKSRNYYLSTLSLSGYVDDWIENPSNVNATAIPTAQSIIDDYDFIGITERLDESLVVLQMLLDLPIDDLLYLTAKSSGGYDDGAWENRCVYITPKFVSSGMKEWFDGEVWQNAIKHDLAIYKAAEKSLDLTIEKLGPEFYRKLGALKKAQALAVEKCQGNSVFPCLSDGTKATKRDGLDCLWSDSGCGAGCLDSIAARL